MRLTRASLANPSAVAIVAAVVVLLGIISIFRIPAQLLPQIKVLRHEQTFLQRFGDLEPELFVERIPFRETRDYVKKVSSTRARSVSKDSALTSRASIRSPGSVRMPRCILKGEVARNFPIIGRPMKRASTRTGHGADLRPR